MLQKIYFVVAVAFLAVTGADDVPEKCKTPPRKVHFNDCCKYPIVFDEKAMTKCGFPKPGSTGPHHHGGQHSGPPPCDKDLCAFKEMKLMSDDENVDTTAAAELIKNSMLGQDADWAEVVDDVTKNCLKDLTEEPIEVCQPVKVIRCIRDTMFQKCPTASWTNSDDCNELKQFRSECPHPHGPPRPMK